MTVGLITYNGAEHIRPSIESVLGQSFSDLRLLIFDNASTDGTTEICAEYASKDPRVTHVRHSETVPQSSNFRGVLLAADTELFMWATDDDIRMPTFVERCVDALDLNPGAVAACTEVAFRSADGTVQTPARGTFSIVGAADERLRTYYENPRDSSRLFGVYRTHALKRSYPVDTSVFGYDWLVVGLSMLYGHHLEVPGLGLVRRANAPGKYFERYDRHFVRGPGLAGKISYAFPLFPLTRVLRQNLQMEMWRRVRWRMLRLNVHQSLLLVRWRFPCFERLFKLARRADPFR